MLQSDWRGEYRVFIDFLNQNGIIFKHSCPYTYHQNGLVERKYKHIIELRLALLAQVNLPFKFVWDAIHTTVYYINRHPTPVLKLLSPFEKLFKHKPDYSFLKCFGCLCYPYLRDFNKHKSDFHTNKCIFIGYSPSHKGYKCLTSSGQVHIIRHVIFDENTFPYYVTVTFPHLKISQNMKLQYQTSLNNKSIISQPYSHLIAALKILTQQVQQDKNKHFHPLHIQILYINKNNQITHYQNLHILIQLTNCLNFLKHTLNHKIPLNNNKAHNLTQTKTSFHNLVIK